MPMFDFTGHAALITGACPRSCRSGEVVAVGQRFAAWSEGGGDTAVRELVDRGLVSRESSPADRRLTLLVPTEKSLGARASIDEVWSGTIRAAMARLDPDQVAALEAASPALRALHAALRARNAGE